MSTLPAADFAWYKPVSGSLLSPGSWEVLGEETLNPDGTFKDPNPNKKIPGASDTVAFAGDAFSAYEVGISGGQFKYFQASGSFGLPSLTQPVTFNLSGTVSSDFLTSRIPVILKGGGELYAKESGVGPNQVIGMTVTGGTTLRVENGSISDVTLEGQSTAVLSDVGLNDNFLKPALSLTDSTLKTGGKIDGQTISLGAGSVWEHNSSPLASLSIGALRLEGGSRFHTDGPFTVKNLNLKESSSVFVTSLTNPVKGLSVSGSGLFATTATLNGGTAIFFPNGTEIVQAVDITKDAKVELGAMILEQGWLRVSDRAKLRTGTAQMGTKGAAGILVEDPGSEWTITNEVAAAGLRVRRGGFAQFGDLVSKLGAVVQNPGSELRFITALNAVSLSASDGGAIHGESIDLGGGAAENASIYLTNALNLGLQRSSSFSVVNHGYLECETSTMGAGQDGFASMEVIGKGSLWLIHKQLTLGSAPAAASLAISDQGVVAVGPDPDSPPAGKVTIGGESSVSISGLLSLFQTVSTEETVLGDSRTTGRPADLKVLAGGSFSARKLTLGSSGEATITVQGTGSSMNVWDKLALGTDGGKGTMTIRDGAGGEAKSVQIGVDPLRESSILVTGTDSRLNASEGIDIGLNGVGVLTLADHATLSLGDTGAALQPIRLGVDRRAQGTLVIDGSSAIVDDRSLRLGVDGTGILTVSGGGALTTLDCIVGAGATSSGTALVTGSAPDGARSRFHMQNLYVNLGGANAATFDITAAGAVRVAKLVDIRPGGTLRFKDASLAVGVGGDSASDCVIWPGGTLLLEPGGNLFGGPGKLIIEGGTLTTKVPPSVPAPSPLPPRSAVLAQAAPLPNVATISAGVTLKQEALTVVQIDPTAIGSSSPALRVTGPVTLAGKLRLEFIDGFAPLAGQKFKLFDFQSTVIGQFAQIEITGLAPGFQYDVKPDASGQFTLTALNTGIPLSPPSLSVARTDLGLKITWPTTTPSYILQTTKTLTPANWQPIPSTGSSLEVQPSQAQEFFRLMHP